MSKENQVIGVVGAGTMGNGIAQVSARAGYDVIMHDVREEFLDRGMHAIDKSLQRDVDKERLDAQGKQSIIGRIKTTTDFASFKDASFVVEAVTENLALKQSIFQRAGAVNRQAILMSNSSVLPIGEIARRIDSPERAVGMGAPRGAMARVARSRGGRGR